MAIERIDTPFHARDEIRKAVSIVIAGPVIRDPNWHAKAAHGDWGLKQRPLSSAAVAKQENAAAVLDSAVRACQAIDQVCSPIAIPVSSSKSLRPMLFPGNNLVVQRTAITKLDRATAKQRRAAGGLLLLAEQSRLSSIATQGDQIHQAIPIPVSKRGARAPKEGAFLFKRIGVGL